MAADLGAIEGGENKFAREVKDHQRRGDRKDENHSANPCETTTAAASPNSRSNSKHRPNQRLFEMPEGRRIVSSVDAKDAKLSFEAALGKLESIVESMESGDVPLAELLAKFEEGSKLLKVCESRLKDAELKIEQLKKQKDGKIAFEKFDTTREA